MDKSKTSLCVNCGSEFPLASMSVCTTQRCYKRPKGANTLCPICAVSSGDIFGRTVCIHCEIEGREQAEQEHNPVFITKHPEDRGVYEA